MQIKSSTHPSFLHYNKRMKITRRQACLIVWLVSILGAGYLLANVSQSLGLGAALSLSLLAISMGVPLMRAFTEFSK